MIDYPNHIIRKDDNEVFLHVGNGYYGTVWGYANGSNDKKPFNVFDEEFFYIQEYHFTGISQIVAVDNNLAIGVNNKLPWRLKDDLKHFNKITRGHHIIIGRKTFESCGLLTKKVNLIITHDRDHIIEDDNLIPCKSIKEGINIADANGDDEVIICGGANIYEQSLNYTLTIYLTRVKTNINGDVYYPFDPALSNEWFKTYESDIYFADENNDYMFVIEQYDRAKYEIPELH